MRPGPCKLPLAAGVLVSALLCVAGAAAAQSVVTLLGTPVPDAVGPGVDITVRGTGFPSGSTQARNVFIQFQPAAGGTAVEVAAKSLTAVPNAAGTYDVVVTVPAINVATPTAYLIGLRGETNQRVPFSSGNTIAFSLQPPAALAPLSPSVGGRGTTVTVAITGSFTHFVQGTTKADFGKSIVVGGSRTGLVTVSSPTSAQAALDIPANTKPGPVDVIVTTGTEVIRVAGGFTVIDATPAIASISPTSARQGDTLDVTITGAFTQWVQGTTTASFGAGITVASVAVSSPTTATARITIDAGATIGARDVTVTTGAQVLSRPGGFSVAAGIPVLVSATPASGRQAETLNVALTGQFTHWVNGTSTASFGAGITVNTFAVLSPTTATAAITIAATAAIGDRDVTVTTPGEVVTRSPGFSVLPGLPALVAIDPTSGRQGQTIDVGLTGAFTSWVQGTTTASFGAEISVVAVTVTSATSATARIGITAGATLGTRDVTVSTGAQIVSLSNAFTVNPGTPALVSIAPSSGRQIENHLVSLQGAFTSWVQGATTASFGAGITVNGVTVSSPTSAVADITILDTAALGTRDVVVTTGGQVVSLPAAFTVLAGIPNLRLVAPGTGQQGQTLDVTLTGQFTHWVNGVSTVTFGSGIAITSFVVSSPTSAVARVAIATSAALGDRDVTVTTPGEAVTRSPGFTVLPGTPALVSIAPATGTLGQTLDVALTGAFTSWVQGTTTASLGPGINLVSVTVNSATSATARITITAGATLGARDVAVTTGAELVSLTNAFTVSAIGTVVSINPAAADQGQSNLDVVITGQATNFVQGVTAASFGAGITVNSVTVGSATSATVNITVSAIAVAGTRDVTMTTGSEIVIGQAGFTVIAGPARVLSVLPLSGVQGQTLDVALTGLNTHFVQGATTANFEQGVTINTVTVTSATTATVNITISPIALIGSRTVTLATGTEFATQSSGFTVNAGPAQLASVTPSSAHQAGAATLTIVGTATHFDQGATAVSVGSGVLAGNIVVSSPTSLSVDIAVAATASVGARTLTVTTGGEIVTIAFTILEGLPVLTDAAPLQGAQGASLDVVVNGQFTHFVQGTTTATFGAGITVNSVTVHSPSSATANISISATTPIGGRPVTMTTGGEIATGAAFTVIAGPAALTSISPASGQQGETLSVAVTATATHFLQDITALSFSPPGTGPVISVQSLTITSPTTATATIVIPANALTGDWSASMVTVGEIASRSSAFAVTPGTPVISVLPSVGAQGQTLTVDITGQFTHFLAATTAVSLGTGITVNSVSVTDATHVSINISIDALTTTGPRNVVVTTGAEQVTLDNGFTVTPGPARITQLSPTSGVQGQTLDVQITAVSSHFSQGVTTASFGGITVNSLSITSATTATATITIPALHPTGPVSVALTTLGESASISLGFTVLPGTPVLTGFSPSSARQGQSTDVLVTGAFTHFVPGVTTANFGPGIVVNTVTVTSATAATVNISIDPLTSIGLRSNVTLTTGSEVAVIDPSPGGPEGFSVTAGIAIITTVSPTSSAQGTSLTLTFTGQDTHFQQGQTTLTITDSGITAGPVTVQSATSAHADITIAPTAAVGLRSLTLTTLGEAASKSNAFTVLPGTPIITSITPNSGKQGEDLSVTILGQFTNWAQGASVATFGAGVTVTSLTVSTPTTAVANLHVDPLAATGGRSVSITTGSEVASGGSFTVTTGPAAINTVTPNTGQQGTVVPVSIVGVNTHFAQDVTQAFAGAGVTAGSVTVTSPTQASVSLTIASNAAPGVRTIQLTTQGETASSVGGFTVLSGAPVVQSVAPASAVQGQTLDVVVTGRFTNFVQGTTTAGFGLGVAINSLTVTSATTATVNIAIDPTATPGTRTVTMTTGNEIASLTSAFTVQAGTATVASVAPTSAPQGESLDVVVSGQGTHFAQGSTQASFGSGVTVNLVTVTGPTMATVSISVNAAAALGTRTVTMTTGGESAALADGFSVVAGEPAIGSVSPATGRQAETLDVTVTGAFTHFAQGTTTASFGAGVATNTVSVLSPTLALVNISVSMGASVGSRDVTMTTGGESATRVGGFSVTPGAPAVASVSPINGMQGQSVTLTVTGQFTNFTPTVTSVSLGAGITIGTVTVNGPTQLTVPVTITAGAATGLRTVTVTTNGEVVTAPNGFRVDPGVASIAVITPNVGNPGATNLAITLTGQFTHFATGQTTLSFGSGITVTSMSVDSQTQISALVSIASGATLGARDVTVNTPGEVLTVFGGFTVTTTDTTPPQVLRVSPANAGDVPLNTEVTIEFNEPINRATVSTGATGSVVLVDTVTSQAVAATVAVDASGRVVTLTPTELLAVSRSYNVWLSFSAVLRDPAGNAVSRQVARTFITGFAADNVGPTITSVSPDAGAANVPTNANIVMAFDEAVNAATVANAFQVSDGTTAVTGSLTFSSDLRVVTFDPASNLAASTTYTVTIANGLADTSGNPVTNATTHLFTTGTAADTTAPTLTTRSPVTGADAVAPNVVIHVIFSERIDPSSVTAASFRLTHTATSQFVAGDVVVAADRLSATLTPVTPLLPETNYSYGVTAFRDLAGNQATVSGSTFTTGPSMDGTSPTVVAITPANGTIAVPVNALITIELSEPIDGTSIAGNIALPGLTFGTSLSTDGRTITVTPTALMAPSTSYTITIAALRDLAGRVLAAPVSATFTTSATATADTTAPTLVSGTPLQGATNIAVTTAVSLTFSEPLASWSLPFASSRLQARINGTDVGVAATVVLDAAGTGLTMTPLQPLPGQALITAQLSGLRDLAGNFFSGSARTFTTGPGADTTPPTVVSVTPQPGQTGIGLQPTIALLFSESLDPATVNFNTISVFVGANRVFGSLALSGDNRMVTLRPSLTALSPITVVVTSGVKDLAGNPMADFSTTFTTGATLDSSNGSVATIRPASGATGVPGTTTITLLTTKPLSSASVAGALYVSQNGVLVTGTINITGSGTAIEFVPTVPFAAGALVQVFLEGALDASGRTVTTFQASFTITNPTSTAPSLVRVSPTITTVPLNTVFEAEISEPVATASITAASVRLLDQNGVAVAATVTLRNGNRVIRVVPTAPLQASRQYQLQLNGVTDQQGTALPFTQRFWTTGAFADTVAPSVVAMNPPAGATNVGVNAPIRVRFSESVNPITISDATVAVTASGFAGIAASISFSFGSSDSEVMITPLQPLPDATTITVTVAGVEDPAGNLVTAAAVSWTTRTGADTTAPKVEATSVSSGQSGVPVNSVFTVRFDEPIDALSIGPAGTIGIALTDGVTGLYVPAIVTLEADGRTVTLAPVAPLAIGRPHLLRINLDGSVRDLVGNTPTSVIVSFTTAYAGDVTAPVLTAASPRDADTIVPTNARIELIFNEPIDPAALAGITLQGATPVPLSYALSNSNRTVQLVPAGLLAANTLHTIHVQGVRDPSGNVGVVSGLTFTTAAGTDLITPTVTARSPASQAIGVAPNVMLHVTFSERIDPSTVSTATFRLTHAATSALISSEVVVAADRLSATLRPLSPLLPETTYSYSITSFRDLAGNSGGIGGFSFTTGPAVDEIAPAVQRITPFAGAIDVPVNVQIVVEMSEPVDAASVAGSVTIPGVTGTTTLSTDGRLLTFAPSTLLAASTNYVVTVNGLRDLAGQPMTGPVFAGFVTSATATADTTAPTLSAISPSITTNVPITTNVVLTFSERLAPWSLTDDTPQLLARISGTDKALAATVTLDAAGTAITITPLQPLPGSSLITVRMSGLRDLANNQFNGSRTFTTEAGTDTTPPTVLTVTPQSGQAGIGLQPSISIVFSESLDLNTVNGNTFTVFTGATELSISPTHSADNRIITITPALPALTPITVVVTSGVKDLAGNALADFSTAFTTGPTVDVSTGSVATSRPATGSSGVPATTTITLLTTKPINPASLAGSLYVSQNGVLVNGTINVAGAGTAIEFVPTAPLTAGSFVQVFLDGALDTSGRTITTFQSSFTIVPNDATIAPSVVRSSPGVGNAPRNAVFEVEISEPAATGSITAASVQLLDQTSAVVPTTVTLRNGNRVIRIVPNSTLAASNSYQLRLNGVTDQQGTALPFFARSWTTGVSTDTASPAVVGMTPPANSGGVGVNAVIRVRFSETINPITVSAATIALTGPGFTAIPSSVSFNSGDTEVTVTPLQPLPDQAGLTVAVNGVEDLAGNAITPASAQWTTRVGADTVAPRLEAVSVFSGQGNVPVNSVFTMRYDEPLDPLSVGAAVALIDTTTSLAVASTVTLEADGRTITLAPSAPLAVSRVYNLRTNFGSSLRDMAGNSPSSLFQTFTTASVSDTQPPQIRLTNPDQGAAAVPRNVDLQVLFDEPINAATAVGVKLMQAGVEVPAVRTISNSNRTVILTPSTILAANTAYDLVATDVRDTAGNAMTSPVIITFTTGAGADLIGPALPTISPTGTGVPVTTAVTVTFAEPINPITVPGVLVLRVTNTQAVVNTTVTYSADRRTVTLTPDAPLAAATQYTVILVSTGITDLAGNVMTATTFVTFTTQ